MTDENKQFATTVDRDARFKKLAENRTRKVLRTLKILGNCGNRTNYIYDQEQVDKIFKAIDEELSDVKTKFKVSKKPDFQL